jgi:hypothetical protein
MYPSLAEQQQRHSNTAPAPAEAAAATSTARQSERAELSQRRRSYVEALHTTSGRSAGLGSPRKLRDSPQGQPGTTAVRPGPRAQAERFGHRRPSEERRVLHGAAAAPGDALRHSRYSSCRASPSRSASVAGESGTWGQAAQLIYRSAAATRTYLVGDAISDLLLFRWLEPMLLAGCQARVHSAAKSPSHAQQQRQWN